jgi:hypothetical protein
MNEDAQDERSPSADFPAATLLDRRSDKSYTIDLVLKLYVVLGLLTAVIAIFVFEFETLKLSVTPIQRLALLAAATGASVAILSGLTLAIKKQRYEFEARKILYLTYARELVDIWSDFEGVSRSLLQHEGDSFNQYSIRSIISKLKREGSISDADVRSLQEGLELRNLVVHGNIEIPVGAVNRVASEMSTIIARLSEKSRAKRTPG